MFITIKKRKDFLAASAGKKFITSSFILQMVKRTDGHPVPAHDVRVGFTVTKKMGGAVVRNRIKRRMRESVKEALSRHGQAGFDYVVISRHKAFDCDFSELKRDMEFAFTKIIHHKNNNNSDRNNDKKPNSPPLKK